MNGRATAKFDELGKNVEQELFEGAVAIVGGSEFVQARLVFGDDDGVLDQKRDAGC